MRVSTESSVPSYTLLAQYVCSECIFKLVFQIFKSREIVELWLRMQKCDMMT